MSERLQEVMEHCQSELNRLHNAIRPDFKHNPKLTLVIRDPNCLRREIILTDEMNLAEVADLLREYAEEGK